MKNLGVDALPISALEFKKRLAQLCLTSHSPEMPRRQRDRHIVLKSIVLRLSKDRSYTEQKINAVLADWINEVAHSLEVDHVTLRRALIDEKYLERSEDGSLYRLSIPFCADWFASEIDGIAPRLVIEKAIADARAKHARYQNRKDP